MMTGSRFIQHHPCPKCGSKDNLAEYSNSYYCFGCKYYKKKDDIQALRERVQDNSSVDKIGYALDTTDNIPQKAMQWLLKYNITQQEIDDNGICWSNPDMLVLHNSTTYWQSRVFSNITTQKYKSWGQKPILMYGSIDNHKRTVLTEDILSAITVSRVKGIIGIPMLGTSLSKELQNRLQQMKNPVYVWLDRDVSKKSIRMKNHLRSLGLTAKSIITNEDPKAYTKQQTEKILI